MGKHPEQGEPLRISIVEDDEEIRAQLALLLGSTPGLLLVSQHGRGDDAIQRLPAIHPDIVLMDINLPGTGGIDCVRALRGTLPEVQILMLTVYEDSDLIFQSLKAGANGYLLKRIPGDKLIEAIQELRKGGAPMSSQIARKVVQYFNQQEKAAADMDRLTCREKEVLHELAQGRPYKEIADVLKLSIDTVRKHLQSIYQKLHVHNRTEAVVRFLQK